MPDRLPARPAGVVFDCDGLLVDTEPSWTVAEAAVFASRGRGYGLAEKRVLLGRSVPDSAVLMAEMLGEPGNELAIHDQLLAAAAEAITAGATAMPGAVDLVARLAGRLPIAVASNSPRSMVDLALAAGGLRDAFDTVVCADDVASPKPAPDLYLAACLRLGVAPTGSVAFEDSATGVAAARAAGMVVVGVPTLGDGLPADLVLPSLADPGLLSWAAGLLNPADRNS